MTARAALKKPDYELKASKFKIAKWTNQKTVNGRTFPTYSYTLVKSWTTDGTNWSEAKMTLFPEELPALTTLLSKVQSVDIVEVVR